MEIRVTCLHIYVTTMVICMQRPLPYLLKNDKKACHNRQVRCKERSPSNLRTLAESIDCAKQFPLNSPLAQELNQAVCTFLAKGMHSISTVEEACFRNLMYKLNPRYRCPSRKHFLEKELPQLYAHVRDIMIKPQMQEVSCY